MGFLAFVRKHAKPSKLCYIFNISEASGKSNASKYLGHGPILVLIVNGIIQYAVVSLTTGICQILGANAGVHYLDVTLTPLLRIASC